MTDFPPGFDDVRPLVADPIGRLYLASRDWVTVAVRVLDVSVPGRAERRQFRSTCLAAPPGQRGVLNLHEIDVTADHRPYLVTDPPTGMLAAQLAVAPLDWQQATGVAAALARTLAQAHQHGVVHLDVRPENVVQSGTGDPLLAWFGVTRAVAVAGQADLPLECLVHAGRELFGWDTPGPPADVYGLGSTIYAMLSGAAPYAGEARLGRAALYSRVLRGGPPPIARPGIPPGLVELIAAMMDPDPANRPGPADVAENLDRLDPEGGVLWAHPALWPLPARAGAPLVVAAPLERSAAAATPLELPAAAATPLKQPAAGAVATPPLTATLLAPVAAPVSTPVAAPVAAPGASPPGAGMPVPAAAASDPLPPTATLVPAGGRRGRHAGLLLLLGIALVALAAGLVWGAVTGPRPQHPRTTPTPVRTVSARPIPPSLLAAYRVSGVRLARKPGGVLVTWSVPATRAGVSAFLVAAESGGVVLSPRTVGPAIHSALFPGLRPGQRYCFVVSTIIETASRQTGTAASRPTCITPAWPRHRHRTRHRHTHR